MKTALSNSGAPVAKGCHAEPHSIEPMHSFSHGHHDQRHIVCGRVRTHGDEVAQHGAHTSQPMHAAYNNKNFISLLYLDIYLLHKRKRKVQFESGD